MILNKLRLLEAGYLWQQIYKYAQKFPNLYVLPVLFVAVAGFAYLLLFPLLMLTGMWTLATYAATGYTMVDTFNLVFWSCITGISAINTIHILKIKFRETEGITLEGPMAANLRALLEKLNREIPIPPAAHNLPSRLGPQSSAA